jgi:hypothetical protein
VVQAIMRHARMDMTLYSSHSPPRGKASRKGASRLILEEMRVQCGSQRRFNEREVVRELAYNHEPTEAVVQSQIRRGRWRIRNFLAFCL